VDPEKHGVPVGYVLHESKDAEAHACAFDILKANCQKKNPDFNVDSFMLDCEKAEKKSVLKSFEGKVKVYWCEFHVKQAWHDNLKKLVSDAVVRESMYKDLEAIMRCDIPAEVKNDAKAASEHVLGLLHAFYDRWHQFPTVVAYVKKEWENTRENWCISLHTGNKGGRHTNNNAEAIIRVIKQWLSMQHRSMLGRRMDELVHSLKHKINPWYEMMQVDRTVGARENKRQLQLTKARMALAEAAESTVVHWVDKAAGHAIVDSFTEPGKHYTVRGAFTEWRCCDCPDAKYNGTVCKHQLKVIMVTGCMSNEQLEAALGRFWQTRFGGMQFVTEAFRSARVWENGA
jgi:hypothetical protein